jgi:hypothetical protein
MDSGTDLGIRSCRANQRQRKNRSYKFLHGVFLLQKKPHSSPKRCLTDIGSMEQWHLTGRPM